MKKILVGITAVTAICFIIPIIFTKPFHTIEISMTEEVQENNQEEKYTYSKYGSIRLFHSKTSEVEELPIDEYLYGVVCAEMPADFEMEALKAQAVVARTYTIYKIENQSSKHENADICDDSTCCQAWIAKEERFERWEEDKREDYWSKIVSAVEETKGEYISYEGKPINAFFHANSGGKTESPFNVWGGNGYPYLQTVTTAGEDAYTQYQSEAEYTFDEVREIIKQIHNDFEIDFTKNDCIQILERTEGNRVKKIKFGNKSFEGTEIRNIFKLKSANFEVTLIEDKVRFEVFGYGHGVGMSQTGADSLAKQGIDYQEIIHHFYTNVEIKQL